jgi:hypothetical protein
MNKQSQRQQSRRWMLASLSFAALLIVACSETSAEEPKVAPAKVEPIEGSKIARVTLVESASDRLGIQIAPVREMLIAPRRTKTSPELRKVIAYSAVIYDTTGAAWLYTNPQPLAYIRQPISIEYSEGDITVLLAGPPTGMQVVVVGAAELYGAETGVK